VRFGVNDKVCKLVDQGYVEGFHQAPGFKQVFNKGSRTQCYALPVDSGLDQYVGVIDYGTAICVDIPDTGKLQPVTPTFVIRVVQ